MEGRRFSSKDLLAKKVNSTVTGISTAISPKSREPLADLPTIIDSPAPRDSALSSSSRNMRSSLVHARVLSGNSKTSRTNYGPHSSSAQRASRRKPSTKISPRPSKITQGCSPIVNQPTNDNKENSSPFVLAAVSPTKSHRSDSSNNSNTEIA